MATPCKYRKTAKGEWVVCGPVAVVKPGATVAVVKAGGSTNTATIASVGKPFEGGLVYGYLETSPGPAAPRGGDSVKRSAAAATRRNGELPCRDCGGPLLPWMDGAGSGLCHDCF
jgi:hypothetical protein